jgi:hypothetical protein
MFRIVIFVENKRLGDALEALNGLAHSIEAPQPVRNVEIGPHGDMRAATPNGTASDVVLAHIRQHKLKEVTWAELNALVKAAGRSAPNHAITDLVKKSILRKLDYGRYRVTLNGKVKKTGAGVAKAGGSTEAVLKLIKAKKLTQITGKDLRDVCVKMGLKAHSAFNVMRSLNQWGITKPTAKPGVFKVLKHEV